MCIYIYIYSIISCVYIYIYTHGLIYMAGPRVREAAPRARRSPWRGQSPYDYITIAVIITVAIIIITVAIIRIAIVITVAIIRIAIIITIAIIRISMFQ